MKGDTGGAIDGLEEDRIGEGSLEAIPVSGIRTPEFLWKDSWQYRASNAIVKIVAPRVAEVVSLPPNKQGRIVSEILRIEKTPQ